jgi:RNA polymerase sigma-70 factor (ECF subfamily)
MNTRRRRGVYSANGRVESVSTALEEVVRRARDGDEDAFESVVQHYGRAVYRLAAAIVGPDDARDVAQESLVAAWRDLPNLRRVDRFDIWLRRIVINRSRNALRSRGRRPTEPLVGVTVAETASPNPDFRDAVHARDALDAAFGELSPDHRAAVVLHYGADLSIRETAAAMGVAVGTAKSRLNAALRRMRAVMEGDR